LFWNLRSTAVKAPLTAGGSEAVLVLARKFGHAISARQEAMHRALYAYDHAAGARYDDATKFLHAIQRADSGYEASSGEALERYRETIQGSEGR
jgi:hypothetical protein